MTRQLIPEPASFSVVRKLDRPPIDVGRNLNDLCRLLYRGNALPPSQAEGPGIRTSGPEFARFTLATATLVSQAIERHSLREIEQAVDKALPISSRWTQPTFVANAECLLSSETPGGETLYGAVGVLLVQPLIDTEIAAIHSTLGAHGASVPQAIKQMLIIADRFTPASKDQLAGTLQLIDLALPHGTELPMRSVEFLRLPQKLPSQIPK